RNRYSSASIAIRGCPEGSGAAISFTRGIKLCGKHNIGLKFVGRNRKSRLKSGTVPDLDRTGRKALDRGQGIRDVRSGSPTPPRRQGSAPRRRDVGPPNLQG